MNKINWYITLALTISLLSLSLPMAEYSVAGDDLLLLVPSIAATKNAPKEPPRQQFSINNSVVKFNSADSEADLVGRGVAAVKIGSQTIYLGTQQKTSINQDPIMRSFDNGNSGRAWLRQDFEVTGADGRGVSLLWTGEQLYASFTVDGTQGVPAQDFRRASQTAQQSWLRSYGAGGGPNASVVALIDPASGELLASVYLTAVLTSGRSNTLLIRSMRVNTSGNLEVVATSFFSPRNIDGSPLTRFASGPSPFTYRLELAADLSRALSASSPDF